MSSVQYHSETLFHRDAETIESRLNEVAADGWEIPGRARRQAC